MATLNWLVPGAGAVADDWLVADGRCFKQGKESAKVWLRSRESQRSPKAFEVWERSDRVRRRFLLGPREQVLTTLGLQPWAEKAETYWGGPWPVSTPSPWGQASLYFRDGFGGRSGEIGVTSVDTVSELRRDPSRERTVAVDVGVVDFEYTTRRGSRGEVHMTHDVHAAVDPDVEVTLLFPGGPPDHDLLPYVREYARWASDAEPSDEELAQLSDGALTPDHQFEWRPTLDNGEYLSKFTLAADEVRPVAVHLFPPSEGRFAYALKVSEAGTDSREADANSYAIGDIVVLEARGDEIVVLL